MHPQKRRQGELYTPALQRCGRGPAVMPAAARQPRVRDGSADLTVRSLVPLCIKCSVASTFSKESRRCLIVDVPVTVFRMVASMLFSPFGTAQRGEGPIVGLRSGRLGTPTFAAVAALWGKFGERTNGFGP